MSAATPFPACYRLRTAPLGVQPAVAGEEGTGGLGQNNHSVMQPGSMTKPHSFTCFHVAGKQTTTIEIYSSLYISSMLPGRTMTDRNKRINISFTQPIYAHIAAKNSIWKKTCLQGLSQNRAAVHITTKWRNESYHKPINMHRSNEIICIYCLIVQLWCVRRSERRRPYPLLHL